MTPKSVQVWFQNRRQKLRARAAAAAAAPPGASRGRARPGAAVRGLRLAALGGGTGGAEGEGMMNGRASQEAATRLLAELLSAPDLGEAVAKNAASLTEEFFMVASTYMNMAQGEGNDEVVETLSTVLEAAFQERMKTLPPEIRLLNVLMRAEDAEAREAAMAADPGAIGPPFFKLAEQMLKDVSGQPAGQERDAVLAQLEGVLVEAREFSGDQPST